MAVANVLVTVTVTVIVACVVGTVDVATMSVAGGVKETDVSDTGVDCAGEAVEVPVQMDGFPARVAMGPFNPICSSYTAGWISGRVSCTSTVELVRIEQAGLKSSQLTKESCKAVMFVQPFMKSPWKP